VRASVPSRHDPTGAGKGGGHRVRGGASTTDATPASRVAGVLDPSHDPVVSRTFAPDRGAPAGTLRPVTLRVVVAEDSLLVREGIVRLLDATDEVEVVAAVGDLDALLAAVDEHRPDVVLTDIRMPPTGTDEGIRAALRLRDAHPGTGVVVLSQYVEPTYALELLEAGSQRRAYLLKERVGDPTQLVGAIAEVARGGSVIDPKVVDALVEARTAQSSPLDVLTPREREVLAHIAQGKNNAAVAEALVLSPRAVEKHINSLFAKLGLTEEPDVHRRVKAVLLHLADAGGSDVAS
jgi:DNA-binding NarL/FixJ family response regulator